ncbi:MAG TPA: glycosyltransferase family 2 protein [Candidatus Saccharimonadales bacterium]|nr:glycosyltransferase family 2 protein [Candidatus Saccharimonadales bacterium]
MTDYLDKTLGHFRDPHIGWVQAPSIYGNTNFWTARGAAEQDMGMQGPIQMGLYGRKGTPIIIGSHCTYRTAAIRQIGGFQPTRAEDHLDTLALAANGWSGVFIPEAIAIGDGPETLPAYLSQQYAWARSMFQILIGAGHSHLRRLPIKQRLHFLFFETWYPLCSGAFLILFAIPIASIVLHASPIRANLLQFIVHLLPMIIAMILLVCASKPLMQPNGLRFSWRGMLLHVVRWPIVVTAIAGVLMRRQKPYQITPKGKFLDNAPTLKLYRPFICLGALSAAAVLYATIKGYEHTTAGQEFFAGYAAMIMLVVCLIDLHLRLRETGLKPQVLRKNWLAPITAVFGATTLTSCIIAYALIVPVGSAAATSFEESSQWAYVHITNTLQAIAH